jgi:hypothetical protein
MSRPLSLSACLVALTAFTLSMMQSPARPEPARAAPSAAETETGGFETSNCFGTRRAESCVFSYRGPRFNPYVIQVPPLNEQDRAAAEARDRRWVARCQPTVRQDALGVPRYIYAAPDCEYGRLD